MVARRKKDIQGLSVVFVGIDWADSLHAFHLLAQDDGECHGLFQQDATEIESIINGWRKKFPGSTLLVAIEQSRGPLINALLKYEDVIIYPVNPASLASYRKAFAHGGGKNDPADARLLAQYLQHYHQQLKPLRQDQPLTRELASLAEHRRQLVDQRAALGNELRAILKLYFPAVIQMRPAQMHADFVLRLLLQFPTLKDAQKATRKKLQECLRGGTALKVQQRVETIIDATPLSEEDVLLRTSSRRVTALCRRMTVLNEIISEYDADIARLIRQHDNYEIIASLPGASDVTQCRIIAALGDDRSRFEDASALQATTGIAPLTTQSGRMTMVTARWACTKFLKQTFHEFAGLSIRKSEWAKAYYHLQRSRGKSAQMAIRALAFKWQRIIYRCWQNNETYNEEHYIKRLKETRSPLYELIKNNRKTLQTP